MMNEPKNSPAERKIFLAALNLDGESERASFLDQVCGDDPALRARVEELLRNVPEDSYLEEPAAEKMQTTVDSGCPDEKVGTVIGRYKLLERLGEGGFGVVWAAEQREPVKRRVALKIIKLGMDTKQVVARFEAESQALALMDHPNIAKVLDAGATEGGRPYFVMELVRGIPITTYCEQEKTAAREQIELFIKVCHALQHAHQKGIIHRDIKPSNILVTLHDGAPVPKVIDFGIAKATQTDLTDKTIYTQFQQFIGTPAYMSPEQAEMSGLDIDTRSDVYSLGVLLYELLTGATPFDAKELAQSGVDEMRRIIREKEPLRPSTKLSQSLQTVGMRSTDVPSLQRETIATLRGDLDWIVMKCLEKDRGRRYDTANGLALDLGRHLKNEPVTARPPSAVYKLSKAWRRNKLVMSAAAAVAASLVIGLAISLQKTAEARQSHENEIEQRIEANIQREAAETSAQHATAESRRAKAAEEKAEAEAERYRRIAYAADMNLVQRHLEVGHLGNAITTLREHMPQEGQVDVRGWEWRHLRGLCHGDAVEKLGTIAPVGNRRLQVTSDGLWLIATEHDSHDWFDAPTLYFNLKTRRFGRPDWLPDFFEIIETAPQAPLSFCVQSHIDQPPTFYLVRHDSTRIELESLNSGSELLAASANAARFSADGAILMTKEENRATREWSYKRWNTSTGEWLDTRVGEFGAVALSNDGSRCAHLVSDSRRYLQIWDFDSELVVFENAPAIATGIPQSLAFSPDDERIAGVEWEGAIKVWEISTGRLLHTFEGHRSYITSLNFLSEGKILASTSVDHTIRLWDMETGKPLNMLRGHEEEVGSAVVLPDGKTLISQAFDGAILEWHPQKARQDPLHFKVPIDGRNGRYLTWMFSSDGQAIYYFTTGRIYRSSGRRFQDSEPLATLDISNRLQLTFADARDTAVYVTDAWEFFKLSFHQSVVRKTFLGRFENIIPYQVDVDAGHVLALGVGEAASHRGALFKISLNGDGAPTQLPVTPIEVKMPLQLKSDAGWTFLRTPQGAFEMVSFRDEIMKTIRLKTPESNKVIINAALSPDQAFAAMTFEPHRTQVFSLPSGELIHDFNGHLNGAKALAMSPEGRLLTGTSRREAVKIWDLSDHPRHLVTLQADAEFWGKFKFSPNGNSFGAYSSRDAIHIWRAPSWEEIEQLEAEADEIHSPFSQ